MARLSRLRLRFATAGLLLEMRKQFAKQYPGKDCPVKNLSDYSPEHRSALMAGVEQAVSYVDPAADEKFSMWVDMQAANEPEK